ncbi:MAG: Bug family tripartite tricarboxylate transporter substrate binding protein [Rhodoferax sp.]
MLIHLPNWFGRIAAVSVLALAAAAPAQAQTTGWPERPVRIVVPFPAGGSTDLLARVLATHLGKSLGQNFIVDNRGGANGNLGAAFVATAPADGYTLMVTTTGPLALNKFMYKSTPFDPLKDFTPISKVSEIPLVVAANPSVPAKDLRELVTYAKAHPGELTYSTTGLGSMGNLTALLFQQQTGIKLTHVPYSGSAQVMKDLLGGVVNLSFDLAPNYAQHVVTGKLQALAVTSLQRSPMFPQTATLNEQGVKNFQATGWIAMVGPANLPPDVVRKAGSAVNGFLASAEGKEALQKLGMEPTGGSPAQLAEFMRQEINTWKPIAESVNVE